MEFERSECRLQPLLRGQVGIRLHGLRKSPVRIITTRIVVPGVHQLFDFLPGLIDRALSLNQLDPQPRQRRQRQQHDPADARRAETLQVQQQGRDGADGQAAAVAQGADVGHRAEPAQEQQVDAHAPPPAADDGPRQIAAVEQQPDQLRPEDAAQRPRRSRQHCRTISYAPSNFRRTPRAGKSPGNASAPTSVPRRGPMT